MLRTKLIVEPSFLKSVRAEKDYTFIRVYFDDTHIDVPQGMIWSSRYTKDSLVDILNK